MVAERYGREGPKQLAAVLGRSEDSVTGLARRFGLRSSHRRDRQAQARTLRNTTVDARFFETPSPNVAYVLGVLFCWGAIKTNTRHVLRLRCPIDRESVLVSVLAMMGSDHARQRGRRRILVEVGNSRLVASLVGGHGKPPDRAEPDPPVPTIVSRYITDFARGHLQAGGEVDQREVVWSGSPKSVQAIRDAVEDATGVTPAVEKSVGVKRLVAYRGPLQIMSIGRWLSANGNGG